MSTLLVTGCNGETVKEITLFKKGNPLKVENKKMLFSIENQVLSSAKNIDDVLKIILEPSQIAEIIDKEDGVEIIFNKEQKVYKINNKYPIIFTKVYVPLSGKYERFGIVFFFGDAEGYGSMPPYVNTKELKQLKQIIGHAK